ncbi:MAG TPA: glycosyltransferase family 2 protein [Thermoanaerobaculia bacterium]|nr:glycosyltransferase family 2 protein [Thermoanaerobaculia bacterium]
MRYPPLVQAIVVHHRGSHLLADCLGSLLDSQGVRVEVVVVANACEEPLPEIVERDSRVHVVSAPRSLGFAAANNLGVRWARANLAPPDALYFVNNDTVTEAPALAALWSVLDSAPACGIVGPELVIQGAEHLLNSLGLKVTEVGEAWDDGIGRPVTEFPAKLAPDEVLAVTGSALLVLPKAFDEVGEWSEIYGFYYEDIDLCLKARSHGWTVLVTRDAVVRHAISATSDEISDFKRHLSWRNQFLLLTVHWPLPLLAKVLPRLVAAQLWTFVQRVRLKAYGHARLQARAWAGALAILPKALVARRRIGPGKEWARLLQPPGSVPNISLPRRRPGASAAQSPRRLAAKERSTR